MTLNLHALKRYEHWLNENAGSHWLDAYHKMPIDTQLAMAEQWAAVADARADRSLQEDWSKG